MNEGGNNLKGVTRKKKYNVAQIGTFDLENYGDLLFPFVLESELKKYIDNLNIVLLSPLGGRMPFQNNLNIYPISDLELLHNKYNFDAIIIGGGDLIRLDLLIADEKKYPVKNATLDLWVYPTIIANKYKIPVLWNCPGVPFDFDSTQIPLVESILNSIDYLAVRDRSSKHKLSFYANQDALNIFPDSVVNIRNFFAAEDNERIYQALCNKMPFLNSSDYIIFQISSLRTENDDKIFADILYRIKNEYNVKIIILPIGYVHDDVKVCNQIFLHYPNDFYFVNEKLSPLELLSIISHSKFFIGSSLHGSITAFSYNIRCISLNHAHLVKLKGFYELVDRIENVVGDPVELFRIFSKNWYNKHDFTAKSKELNDSVDIHMGNIANFILNRKKVKETDSNVNSVIERLYTVNKIENQIHDSLSFVSNLYLDMGQGFSENNKFSDLFVSSIEGTYEYAKEFSMPVGVKSVRFDPVEGKFCVVKDLQVITNNGIMSVCFSNCIKIDEVDFFETTDPQYIIDFESKDTQWVLIKARVFIYRDVDILSMFSKISNLKFIINLLREKHREYAPINFIDRITQLLALEKETSEQISSLNQTVAEQNAKIDSLDLGISERNQQISAILNSSCWKLTKPMRLVGDFLRWMLRWFRFSLRIVFFSPKRFDSEWYLKQNPDVATNGMDPYKHYILFGKAEGRKPAPDTAPLRKNTSSIFDLLRIVPKIVVQKGGTWRICTIVFRIYHREGFAGIKWRIEQLRKSNQPEVAIIKTSLDSTSSALINLEENQLLITEDATISVIIPTLNADEYFPLLLPMLRKQKGLKQLEIIVVDSGSTDKTLELVKEYDAKLVQIPPEKFSHSYSRNLGAEKATGNFLFFTVQDALPPSDLFLRELLDVLNSKEVAAVSCAEFPRENTDLFYRVACWNHYEFLGVNSGDRIMSKPAIENYITLRQNGQLSDIACLITRDLFMKYTYQYDYAEDLDLGIRLIKDGYNIAFLSSLKIIHSHNRSPFYFLKRGYADQVFLTKIFPDYPRSAIKAEWIAGEIILAYKALNHFVIIELDQIAAPCRTMEFISNITESFTSKLKKSDIIDFPNTSPYIDENFGNFLKDTQVHAHVQNKSFNGSRLALLQGTMDFVRAASFPYLFNSTEIIDEQTIMEFKGHLYKIFALICGVNIANSYIESPDDFDNLLGEIRGMLMGGV